MSGIKYRAGYRYQLAENYLVRVNIVPKAAVVHEYFTLLTTGDLGVRRGYAWDGPSGPACDTLSAMRGSLVHDILYQMMRLGLLTKAEKKTADSEYYRLCIEDGMWTPRARWQLTALRIFGGQSTEHGAESKVLTAP